MIHMNLCFREGHRCQLNSSGTTAAWRPSELKLLWACTPDKSEKRTDAIRRWDVLAWFRKWAFRQDGRRQQARTDRVVFTGRGLGLLTCRFWWKCEVSWTCVLNWFDIHCFVLVIPDYARHAAHILPLARRHARGSKTSFANINSADLALEGTAPKETWEVKAGRR